MNTRITRQKLEVECAQLEDLCAEADACWAGRSWPDIDEAADFLGCWLQVMKRRNWLIDLLQTQQSDQPREV